MNEWTDDTEYISRRGAYNLFPISEVFQTFWLPREVRGPDEPARVEYLFMYVCM